MGVTYESLLAYHQSTQYYQDHPEEDKTKGLGKFFYQRTLKQSKKLSQLIVKSWDPEDEEGKTIRVLFINFDNTAPATDPLYEAMQHLLTGQEVKFSIPPKPRKGQEQKHYTIPKAKSDDNYRNIFNKDEILEYRIRVDCNTLEGSVIDSFTSGDIEQPPFFILNLPYPGRTIEIPPLFANKFENGLQKWLNEPVNVNDPNIPLENPFAPSPYLPQTTT